MLVSSFIKLALIIRHENSLRIFVCRAETCKYKMISQQQKRLFLYFELNYNSMNDLFGYILFNVARLQKVLKIVLMQLLCKIELFHVCFGLRNEFLF